MSKKSLMLNTSSMTDVSGVPPSLKITIDRLTQEGKIGDLRCIIDACKARLKRVSLVL